MERYNIVFNNERDRNRRLILSLREKNYFEESYNKSVVHHTGVLQLIMFIKATNVF